MGENTFKFNWFHKNLLLLLFIVFQVSCSEDDPVADDQFLVNYSKKIDLTQRSVQDLAKLFGKAGMADLLENEIRVYRLTYNTTYFNQDITASGVVALPVNFNGNLPVISASRGTIFADSEAPSLTPLIYGFEILASAGYVVVIADMIGFGESSGILHPYFNKDLSAQSTYDMLKATLELLPKEDYTHNGQLFMMGYSEGGYICTASHQMIEGNPIEDLSLTAVATGAGSYNINFVMENIVNRETYGFPGFLAFIVESYRVTNNWNEPLSDFFNEPYASEIPGVLEGSLTGNQINEQLNDTIDVLFRKEFIQEIRDGEEDLITPAFTTNSVHYWEPVTTTIIYHSPGDEYIPIAESQATANGMKDRGGNVEFVELEDLSHSDGAIDMVEESLLWFETLRN
ncbi:alpha/beta hydrolase family protein [Bacteroidota bacterium]